MKPLYKTTVSHSVVLAGTGSQEDVAKAVSSNGGEKIKNAMQQSVSAIADSIIEALNHPEKKTY